MNRMVIDTDPGVDDAHAILMAFAHRNTHIEALTTVAGNVSLQQTTANACIILDHLNAPTPIYPGCSRALVQRFEDAAYVHGTDGLGESGFPRSQRKVNSEHAANALVRLANQFPGELTLTALGPLTNVALAARLDPHLPSKIKRLVVMGGSIHAQGNVTATAEFNTYSDPEAAAIVLDAWQGLELISWETTLQHTLSPQQMEQLLAVNSARGEFFRRITRKTLAVMREFLKREGMYAPDALAVAVALEPDLVRRSEAHFVQVELSGTHTRGQMAVDWLDRSGRAPNVNVVLELDMQRFWELMLAGLQ